MWTTSDHILRFEKEEDQPLSFPDVFETDNLMDKWILSFTQSLVGFVIEEMAGECGKDVVWDRCSVGQLCSVGQSGTWQVQVH